MALTPKNWTSFQHYKDRAPLWIKLHRGLLDNRDYYLLTPLAGKCLPLIWLIASEKDGLLPVADELAFRLRVSMEETADILDQLTKRGFLIEAQDTTEHAERGATPAQRRAAMHGFGSRHISDATKRAAWERDGGVCKQCGSSESIEYDHMHPVSKGGNSELKNIQLLCRPCNRSKRVKSATHAQQAHSDSRSLEKENIEKRKEENTPTPAKPQARSSDDFERFKKAFPRRDGANPWHTAEKKFNALVKTGVDPDVLIRAAGELAREEGKRGNVGTKFIPQAITWLNQQRFQDCAAATFDDRDGPLDWDAVLTSYKKFGHWSRDAGPDLSSPACRCPPEMLEKYGLRTMQ